jgi:arylsulfatase A-like enzyme
MSASNPDSQFRWHGLAALTALAFLTLPIVSQASGQDRPNILFMFSDDHRHDMLGKINLAARTPYLDALADSGVRFDKAFVTTSICSPSRAAVLSGMYGTRNGVATLTNPLRAPEATFVHDIARAGYRCVQAGKWHLGTSPAKAGFHQWATIDGNGSWFQRKVVSNIPGVKPSLKGRFYETFMADVVIDWIADHSARPEKEPFFLWWCHQVPHVDDRHQYPDVKTDPANKIEHKPWGSPGGYRALHDIAKMQVPENWKDLWQGKPDYLAKSRFVSRTASGKYGGPGGYINPAAGRRNPTAGEDNVQQHLLEYHASLTALDAEIGRVLARLDDPNGDGDNSDSIAANTWIVFMGDNGWQTGHHKFTSKVLAYEESCRVPLIVKPPAGTPRVEDKMVLNIDLAPLFHDLAGLAPPAHIQGRNLRELIDDPSAAWRDDFYYEAVIAEPSLDAMPHDALRTDDFKLIRTYQTQADAIANTGEVFEELYDLRADPYELTNLAEDPDHSATKAKLTERLLARKKAIATSPDPTPAR